MHSARLSQWLIGRGGLLALLVVILYMTLAPTTFVDGDNAEFSALGALGGRAHPSGYPSYVLYLRLMSWLPGESPAHTAALATCLLGALAVFALHAAARAWGASPAGASVACALYATSPVVLRMHIEAEVFAGNALVVAVVLWLAATGGPLRGGWRAGALGLVAGLGMANHLTCSLVTPIGVLGVVRAIRETSWRSALFGVAGLALGLSAYGYLLIADGPTSFGKADNVSDLIAFFTRQDYGGALAFASNEVEPVAWSDSLGELVATLGASYLWVGLLLAVFMLGWLVARGSATQRFSIGWALYALCFLLAGPLLALRFNVAPEGLGRYIVHRFHLLPVLLAAIPLAVAIGKLIRDRVGALAVTAGSCAVVLALVALRLPRLRAVHSPAVERGVANTLAPLAPEAIVIATSDELCLGADYLQHALGVRPDVTVLCWSMMSRRWYQERAAARDRIPRVPFAMPPGPRQADALMATGRPLYVTPSERDIARARPIYPEGVLLRVLPSGQPAPTISEVLELNQRIFESYDLDYTQPEPDDDYAALIHRRYAGTWVLIARGLEQAGNRPEADQAMAIAKRLAPGGVVPLKKRANDGSGSQSPATGDEKATDTP